MKEQLTCTECNKKWKREKTRGRKPHQCPKCVKAEQKLQKQKTLVDVTQIKKTERKIVATPITALASTNASSNEDNKEISVGEVFNYYHPSDEKLKEETKGGSTWKCRCGYTLELKLSITAKPTHKCTEHGKSIPMERTDK